MILLSWYVCVDKESWGKVASAPAATWVAVAYRDEHQNCKYPLSMNIHTFEEKMR